MKYARRTMQADLAFHWTPARVTPPLKPVTESVSNEHKPPTVSGTQDFPSLLSMHAITANTIWLPRRPRCTRMLT